MYLCTIKGLTAGISRSGSRDIPIQQCASDTMPLWFFTGTQIVRTGRYTQKTEWCYAYLTVSHENESIPYSTISVGEPNGMYPSTSTMYAAPCSTVSAM